MHIILGAFGNEIIKTSMMMMIALVAFLAVCKHLSLKVVITIYLQYFKFHFHSILKWYQIKWENKNCNETLTVFFYLLKFSSSCVKRVSAFVAVPVQNKNWEERRGAEQKENNKTFLTFFLVHRERRCICRVVITDNKLNIKTLMSLKIFLIYTKIPLALWKEPNAVYDRIKPCARDEIYVYEKS